jgi:nucleoside-diphosphate-sugar epimerase
MKVLLTGGCGYVGTLLTGTLLQDGHQVTVVDTQWFGDYLKPHPSLVVIKADIRDALPEWFAGTEAVLHLANIANDPSVDLDPTLSWEVNVLAAQRLADEAQRAGVKQFIYASSGSVYGVKEEEKVTEDLRLVPISVYNKTKMSAERVLLSYAGVMAVHCIRPATVCGVSPRMRLDLSVNLLTMQALTNGRMTVFGGDQTRPNIHVLDLVDVYRHFVVKDIESGCYNAGFENLSILDIAETIATTVPADIVVTPSNDPRSYRLDSTKLAATGFRPSRTVGVAIEEVAKAYRAGDLRDDDRYYNVRWMKHIADEADNG